MLRRNFLLTLLATAVHHSRANTPTAPRQEVLGVIEYGQSNAEAQAKDDAAVLRVDYPDKLRMPASAANDVWLGLVTSAGASLELAADAIKGLAPLRGAFGSKHHGSTAGESMVLRTYQSQLKNGRRTDETILFNSAEGGQRIRNLASNPPEGYFAFANLKRTIEAVDRMVRREGKRYVVRVVLFAQGESDMDFEHLGQVHEEVRAQIERCAKAVTGQSEAVWMLSSQASSFGPSVGVRSILAQHEHTLQNGGSFFCLGPTYCYPFSTDYLHHSSEGHAMRGELQAIAYDSLQTTGRWDVLRGLHAIRTNERTIEVRLSETAIQDQGTLVSPAQSLGLSLEGGEISAITLSGDQLVITTRNSASAVSAVRIGLEGHGERRQRESIPRTNIRSARSYGKYRNGADIHKWLCHQCLPLSAA